MKGNQYRKLHPMSKYAKKYFYQHAKLNQIREDKRRLRKAVRLAGKKEMQEQ